MDTKTILTGICIAATLGLAGWALTSTHEAVLAVHDYRGDVRTLAYAVEFHHSVPFDLDVEIGSVSDDGVMLASDQSRVLAETPYGWEWVEAGGYKVSPQAGVNACVGAAHATVTSIEQGDTRGATQRLIALVEYLTGERCRVDGGNLQCG